MSADLELRQELLEIRLPPDEMSSTSSEKASSQSSEITDDDGIRTSSATGSSSSSSSSSSTGEELQQNCQTPKTGSGKGSTSKEGGESGQCRTPSSPGNMIPVILSCPPAPKKQRTSAVSCKRKLVFFDQVVARDEIDSFFRQFAIDVNSKRRCLV